MKPTLILLFVAMALLFITSSCKKKHKPITVHAAIYFAGSTFAYPRSSKSADIREKATYWKNGIPIIPTIDSSENSRANGIFVNGKDVYILGDISKHVNRNDITATYWKNGIATKLNRGTIYGGATKGTDVYMVGTCYGFGNEKAAVWKNNVLDTLGNGRILSIAIEGDDIYMAGYTIVAGGYDDIKTSWNVATYWKNGKAVVLDNTPFRETMASNLFVMDGDVYIPGQRRENAERPLYWKNRDSTSLSPKSPRLYGEANGIYADENNVYACGWVYIPTHDGIATFGAVYWKKGIINYLPYEGKQSFASAIAVQNNVIYIAGHDDYPVYWKNGKREQLGKDKGRVDAMAIVNY